MTGGQKRNVTHRAALGAIENLAKYFQALGLNADAANALAAQKVTAILADVTFRLDIVLKQRAAA